MSKVTETELQAMENFVSRGTFSCQVPNCCCPAEVLDQENCRFVLFNNTVTEECELWAICMAAFREIEAESNAWIGTLEGTKEAIRCLRRTHAVGELLLNLAEEFPIKME